MIDQDAYSPDEGYASSPANSELVVWHEMKAPIRYQVLFHSLGDLKVFET